MRLSGHWAGTTHSQSRDHVILTEEAWASVLRNVARTMFQLPSEFV